MPPIEPFPAVAGREFYCLDRLASPDEQVLAEERVPGHPQLWVVRGRGSHRFVCAQAHLSDVPPERWYRVLRESAA